MCGINKCGRFSDLSSATIHWYSLLTSQDRLFILCIKPHLATLKLSLLLGKFTDIFFLFLNSREIHSKTNLSFITHSCYSGKTEKTYQLLLQLRLFISYQPLSRLNSRLKTILCGRRNSLYYGRTRIESHITDDPPDQDSEEGKTNESYLSWKKNGSLIKSWIRRTLMEEHL